MHYGDRLGVNSMKSVLTPRVTVGERNTKFIFRFLLVFPPSPVLNESVILSARLEMNVRDVQGESSRAPEAALQIACRSSNPNRKGRHSHFHLSGFQDRNPREMLRQAPPFDFHLGG